MNLRLLALSALLFLSSVVVAQKPVDYEMKRQSFIIGVSMHDDFFKKNIPSGVFLNLGYDFRKLYENQNVFIGIGPRVKGGWLSGDNDNYHQLDWLDMSFSTMAWGVSIAPSIGYELLYDPHTSFYLEGEAGIINYHTTAKLSDTYVSLFEAKKKHNSMMNLYTALRLGMRMNVASRKEVAIWIGMSNLNTDDILKDMNIREKRFENKKIYAEIGLSVGL